MNVFDDAWDETPYPTPPGWEQRTKALLPSGNTLGMRLYELPPAQTQVLYHFHHGNEEAVVVLSGTPTVRTPEGERALAAGEPVPAGGAADRVDRHACRHECLDVTVDGPHGHLEQGSELGRRLLASRLEQEKQRDEASRTHLVNMTEEGGFM